MPSDSLIGTLSLLVAALLKDHGVLMALTVPFLLPIITFGWTSVAFWHRVYSSRAAKETIPPTIPYSIPLLGSSFRLISDAAAFLESSSRLSGLRSPFGLLAPGTKLFIVAGTDNIRLLFKKRSPDAPTGMQVRALNRLFGMSKAGLAVYYGDHSGFEKRPREGSFVAPNNRIDFLTHAGIVQSLGGEALKRLHKRWRARFVENVNALVSPDDWIEFPDFMAFWQRTFGLALLEAIIGPILRCVNPDLILDLANYDRQFPIFGRGTPRWMNPQAFAIRDKMLNSIMQWHAIARAIFCESSVDADGDTDPYWGSAFIRRRHEIFKEIDGFDAQAAAASDLGFIWAAYANVTPTSMWQVLEVFQDATLLSRVRAVLEPAAMTNINGQMVFDPEHLKSIPLLESIYAETLRLRVYAYVSRTAGSHDLHLKQWRFPADSLLLVSTHISQMDGTIWNTRDGAHPVEDFWADRFLVYPNDPQSGPGKLESTADTARLTANAAGTPPSSEPYFTTAGTEGAWIPYGGGPRICPGRFFARHSMLGALATVVANYDVEFLVSRNDPALRPDPAFYGLGGQSPVGKVPFRIRRRPCKSPAPTA